MLYAFCSTQRSGDYTFTKGAQNGSASRFEGYQAMNSKTVAGSEFTCFKGGSEGNWKDS